MLEIIKGVIAIVVIIGGGILSYLSPDLQSYVFPVIALVIGYYFGAKQLPILSAIAGNGKKKKKK